MWKKDRHWREGMWEGCDILNGQVTADLISLHTVYPQKAITFKIRHVKGIIHYKKTNFGDISVRLYMLILRHIYIYIVSIVPSGT
jgi:hypothetical protein